jgi:hypothetical protein
MSFLDTPWLQPQPPAETGPADDGDGAFSKGLRSGITSAEGELHALAGGVGEAVGADDFARARYARSKELAQQAAREAPPVGSIRDIHDLHSGFDWLAGTAGRMAPTAALMLGAEAITRGRMPLTAATAATAPLEAGSAIQAQQESPEALKHGAGERLANAAITGTGAALAQNVVPVAMGGKVLGPVAAGGVAKPLGRTIATNVAEAAGGNALGGAAGEGIHQAGEMALDPTKTPDLGRVGEAAATGAAIGVPLGMAGGAGEALRHAPDPAATPLREKAASAFKGFFDRDSTKDESTARAVAADRPVEPMPPGVDPAKFATQNDATATEWAVGKLQGWLSDTSLDEATKTRYADLLQRVTDPVARQEVATIALGKSALDKAKGFYDHLSSKSDELKTAAKAAWEKATKDDPSPDEQVRYAKQWREQNPQGTTEAFMKAYGDHFGFDYSGVGVKKSEDYSGVRAVIAKEIIPAIQKTKPELLQNDQGIGMVADAIRIYLKRAEAGKSNDGMSKSMLRAFLGEDTVPVMERVIAAIDQDPKASERMYAALNDLHTHFGTEDELRQAVIKNLVDKKGLTRDHITSAVDQMKKYTSGEMFDGMGAEKRAFFEKRVRDELGKTFGNNTEKVLEAFQAHHEKTKAESAPDVGHAKAEGDDLEAAKNAARGESNEHTLETDNPPEFEPPRIYGSKDKGLILSHEAHRRDFGDTPSQAERLIQRARTENPDRNVSFMKARDFARERGISDEQLHTMTNGKPDDFGVVAAEGQKQQGRITEEEARRMLLDSKAHAGSKSRIDTDKHGVTLDAVKITKETIGKLPQVEGESNMRRTARAFNEGLGSALIHFDAKVKDLPDSLVIARRNGVDVTLGDIKKAKLRDPLIDTRDLDSDVMDTKRLLEKAKAAGDKEQVAALKDKLEELSHREYGRTMNEGKDRESAIEDFKRERGVYEISKDDQIHMSAAEHEANGTLRHKVSQEGASTKKAAEPEAKPAQPAEHVPLRVADVKDHAKDAMAGGSTAEGVLNHYEKQPPAVMQRLVKEINELTPKNRRERQNANDAIDRLNTSIGEALKKSPDAAYALKLKSAQKTDPNADASGPTRGHVEKYIKDVLGGKVSMEWAKFMHAGEYEHGTKVVNAFGKEEAWHAIRVSVHSLDPMGTAFHESLHAFFQMLRDQGNQGVMKVLYRAADSATVMKQLREHLKDSPEALKQIEKSREERVAYMYQFYSKEMLRLGPETTNVFQRMKEFFMKVLGMWTATSPRPRAAPSGRAASATTARA